jgi:hypothetical protein
MKLKFFNAEEIEQNAKATIHASGKLGFSSDSVDFLKIGENTHINLAKNEEDEGDENLYGVVVQKFEDGAFKVCKAGDYYYLNTKNLFDSLKIDYTNHKIIYDLMKISIEGMEIIKFQKRILKKKIKQ